MAFVLIDADRCRRDGICVESCPLRLLAMEDGGVPQGIPSAEKLCIRCGHCVAVCPHAALTLGTTAPEDLACAREELRITPEAAAQFLRTRRSVRVYQDKAAPRDVLLRVLDVTRWAPTATNRQPVKWLIVESRQRVRELASMVAEGLRAIPYFARLIEEWDKGHDRIFRGAPHVVAAYASVQGFDPLVDCTITLSYLDLAAHAYGLGTCWAGVMMAAVPQNPAIVQFLGIPDGHKLGGAMMIGYPRYEYPRIPLRSPLAVTWR